MSHNVDTLKIYERLKKSELSDGAAKEIAEVLRETSDAAHVDLTTKEDLARTEVRIIKSVAGMLVAQAIVIATLVKLF